MHVLALLSSLLIFSTSLALAEECKPPKANQALQDKIQAYVDENVEPLLSADEAALEKLRSMGNEAAAVADQLKWITGPDIIQQSDVYEYFENRQSLTDVNLSHYLLMLAQIRIGNTASKHKYQDAYEKLAAFNEKTCLLKEDGFLYALASFRYHSTFESTIYSNIDQIRNLRWMTMNSNDAIYEDVYRKFLNDVPVFMVNMEIEYWRERDSSSLCTSAKMRSQCTEEIIDAVGRYRHSLPAKYDLPDNLLEFDSACDAVVYSGDSYMKIDICGRGD